MTIPKIGRRPTSTEVTPMTTLTPTTIEPPRPVPREALEPERDALMQERARLLVDAPTGDRLRVVKARLTAITEALEDLALAERERAARVQAAADAERAAEQATLRTQLEAVERVELPVLAAEIDQLLQTTVLGLDRLRVLQDHADRLRTRLGGPSLHRRNRLVVAGAVAWALRDALNGTGPWPHHAHRHPLAALMAAAAATTTTDPDAA